MVFCDMSSKYVSEAECDLCDKNAGFEKDTWREICNMRFEHHPIRDDLRWWLKPRAFTFKLLIAMRWIVRRLSPRSRISIWPNKDGWHFGQIEFSNWGADS